MDLLVKDAGLLVVDGKREIADGWPAVTNGRVTAVGTAGTEPGAGTTISAAGRLVTPGLVTTHHPGSRPGLLGQARRRVHCGSVRAQSRSHSASR